MLVGHNVLDDVYDASLQPLIGIEELFTSSKESRTNFFSQLKEYNNVIIMSIIPGTRCSTNSKVKSNLSC
jgi:hypothetical protein